MINAYIEQNQSPQIFKHKFLFSFSLWRRFGEGCFRVAAATANGKTGLGAAFPAAITARRAVSRGDGLE